MPAFRGGRVDYPHPNTGIGDGLSASKNYSKLALPASYSHFARATLPSLFAYETAVGAQARVGWITGIFPLQGQLKIKFNFDPTVAPVSPERILDLRWHLKIGEGEMNRTHWAVKKARLLDVLGNAAASIAAAKAAKGEYMFSRRTILQSLRPIELSYT